MQCFSIVGTPRCLHPAATAACASHGLPSCLQCKILQDIEVICRKLKMCACAGVSSGGCAAGGAGGDGLHLGRQPEVPAAGACTLVLAPPHAPCGSSHAPYGVQQLDTCLPEGKLQYWHKHCLHGSNAQSAYSHRLFAWDASVLLSHGSKGKHFACGGNPLFVSCNAT